MTLPAVNTKFHFLKLCRVSDRFSFSYMLSVGTVLAEDIEIVMYDLRMVEWRLYDNNKRQFWL
jgi:hypothetical protein